MRIPLVGPSYNLESRSYDAQRTVNFIPEASESGTSKSASRLLGRAGLNLFTTAGSGPIRMGISTAGGKLYVVSGNTVYEVATDGRSIVTGKQV